MSGFRTMDAQSERLSRILQHWTEVDDLDLDHIAKGDMNLCFTKWTNTADPLAILINKVKSTQVTTAMECD